MQELLSSQMLFGAQTGVGGAKDGVWAVPTFDFLRPGTTPAAEYEGPSDQPDSWWQCLRTRGIDMLEEMEAGQPPLSPTWVAPAGLPMEMACVEDC